MPDEKPLTKSDLVAVLKEIGVATKADIQETEKHLNQNISAVEEGLSGRINNTEEQLNQRVDTVEGRLKQHIANVVVYDNLKVHKGSNWRPTKKSELNASLS